MSSLTPIEGTLSAKPFGNTVTGGLSGSLEAPIAGRLAGTGSIAGDMNESPEKSAIAELSGLISSLDSLSAQAQSLPLSPPSLPGAPSNQGYQPQTTDYLQLSEDSN